MKYLKRLEDVVLAWPEISAHPHRFGGVEFRYREAELGHVHTNGILDIPLPRTVHDVLLSEGKAEQHKWVPDSGWITFRVRGEQDLDHALWLLRLSYLRYSLKTAPDPRSILREESKALHLTTQLESLFEPFLPRLVESRA